MSTIVQATDLTMRFGETEALRGITLGIDRGELFALLGPDGAGKTTFFRLVAGLIRPTGGRVQVASAGTFGLVPQRFSLYEDLTIDENLYLRARLYDVPAAVARERTADLLVDQLVAEDVLEEAAMLAHHRVDLPLRLADKMHWIDVELLHPHQIREAPRQFRGVGHEAFA